MVTLVTAEVDVVRTVGRLRGTLGPLRRRVLEELREPGSATQVAERLGETRQRVAYHVRELERGGLVELVEERRRRGCTERVVRATARAVVVEPDVVGDLRATTQDRFAADTVIAQAARTVRDVAVMRERAEVAGKRLVTFAVEADVGFARPADVARFGDQLADALAALVARFDTGEPDHRFRVTAAIHPAPEEAP
jgi:DNA-binding transcriptional ArsR family regulator